VIRGDTGLGEVRICTENEHVSKGCTMTVRSTTIEWGGVSRLLHWATFVLLTVLVPLGAYMADLPRSATKLRLYALHKSIGLTLFALVVLRVAWRLTERRPQLPAMPAWQRRAATVTHIALYVLMLAVPLAGWLFNSASGFPLQWFGLVNLPALASADPTLKSIAHELHEDGAWLLVGVVALHAAAAFKHHFIDRDYTLASMVPWLRAPRARDRA
jgi:cytochrome b561